MPRRRRKILLPTMARISTASSSSSLTAVVATVLAIMTLSLSTTSEAFTTPLPLVGSSRTMIVKPNNFQQQQQQQRCYPSVLRPTTSTTSPSTTTSLNLLGGDSGILGVGAPEVAVTLLVGYFVLGPSDLYKLVKEIGKFIQNFRTLGAEAAKTFEGTMENQLELTELRKAQSELNEAFSFRRSINTDAEGEAFDKTGFVENYAEGVGGAAGVGVGAATAGGGATATASDGSTVAVEEGTLPKKKKRRLVRRKKKKAIEEEEEVDVPSEDDFIASEYPDLDMLDADLPTPKASAMSEEVVSEEEKLRAERLERLSGGGSGTAASSSGEPDWFTASEKDVASAVLDGPNGGDDPAMEAFEKSRFQSQLSAESWNAQVMDNEDELAPLSMIMKRIAILEEEKNAADKRLEEEYERRMDNEDKYYLEKRRVLEDAIMDIQEGVYGGGGGGDGDDESSAKSEEEVVEEKKKTEESNVGPKFT